MFWLKNNFPVGTLIWRPVSVFKIFFQEYHQSVKQFGSKSGLKKGLFRVTQPYLVFLSDSVVVFSPG